MPLESKTIAPISRHSLWERVSTLANSHNDLRAKIGPASFPQYKPGDFLTIRAYNWDESINQEDDNDN
jgi:hypothetical protein